MCGEDLDEDSGMKDAFEMKKAAKLVLAILKEHPGNHVCGGTLYARNHELRQIRSNILDQLYYSSETYNQTRGRVQYIYAK